ncbi:hypothetical protein JX265_005078 [Neoarthrinium moseri]|uniref:Xylanolytic transcriptional activator regulatory domain-containing protein n=1 Tax=Neoarthrinium moseri TaxID=1658444 RepID=A0A9P9WPE0_9PEZI|nr:hypothetical protein JX265_005078 [Neoarthrinium moseri]
MATAATPGNAREPGGATVGPASIGTTGGSSAVPIGSRPLPTDLQRSNGRRDVDATILKDAAKDHDRIRKLELEVAQLRGALAKQTSIDGTTIAATPSTLKEAPAKESSLDIPLPSFFPIPKRGDGLEFKFVRGHNFKTRFYGPHNAWSSFKELTGLTPFMRETAEEWLRPLNITRKDRNKRREDRQKQFEAPDMELEALLPPKEETDSLVAVYLDQFEQLHRIVHIPTFKKEYEKFWDPTQTRCAAFTALVLAMLAASSCMDMQPSSKFVGIKSNAYQTAERWTKACDAWLDQQSQKHRSMIHYQIMCMIYLAKRINIIKKKRFWTNSGALIREGIIVGLHLDGDQVASRITPYYREMRRRIWATMMEFDLQASFDQGVPTLLSQMTVDSKAPRNIDDEEFDEDTEELPTPKSSTEYTFSSYQSLSRQSLQARLELNRVMTGPIVDLDWERVTRYTEMITQEIDALPPWDSEEQNATNDSRKPVLAHALLHIQLRQYLIPLHQPYLKLRQYNSKYQVAEFIYYTAARDIVLMHDRLFQKGIRSLYFLREDTMSAAVSLCSVSLYQPRESTSLIMSNASETLKLIERCIAIKEDRVLRCGNNDPWGYSSMCAALGLLETHLGNKTFENAKASAAERFIGLHYKLLAYQIPPFASHDTGNIGTTPQNQESLDRTKPMTPFNTDSTPSTQIGATPFHRDATSMPWLLPQTDPLQSQVPNPDFDLNMLGMDLNELWGTNGWEGTDFM